jgi:hypothetical protein
MRSVTSARFGQRMPPKLADMAPAERAAVVWACIHPRLREISPLVQPEWVSVWPGARRPAGSGGYVVEIVCHLLIHHSELEADDPVTIASLVEAQISVGLLSIAGSLRVANIDIEAESAGVLFCVVHVHVPSVRRRRRMPRSRMSRVRAARRAR